jgi:chaperonin GroES
MPRASASKSTRSSATRKRRTTAAAPEDVRLTGDRLVVGTPENGERRSRSGLLIPATAATAPKRCVWGDVALVGPDVRNVKRGDRVLFLPQAGLEVEISGEEYLLLRERDVQAIASSSEDGDHHGGQYL